MPFVQRAGIRYFRFDSLEDSGVVHAIFTRQGGVSQAPWQALNLGGTVGDDPAHVLENRRRAFKALDRRIESLFDVWQVHSADVVRADAPRPPHSAHRKADAILTDRLEVTLLMRFADCVPILLVDPFHLAIGLVHAGWQGTVKRTARAAVLGMQSQYGTQPQDLLAAIGPSIAAHHYEVGPEVADQVRDAFGFQASPLLPSRNSRVEFDLWAANRLVLEEAGVRHIEVAGLCTACDLNLWYSHRAEKGRTGRFGAMIGLKGVKD